MAALREGDVTPGAVGRVVGGVAVVRGHCVPEVLEGRCDSVSPSVMWPQAARTVRARVLLLSHGAGREGGSDSARDCAPPCKKARVWVCRLSWSE